MAAGAERNENKEERSSEKSQGLRATYLDDLYRDLGLSRPSYKQDNPVKTNEQKRSVPDEPIQFPPLNKKSENLPPLRIDDSRTERPDSFPRRETPPRVQEHFNLTNRSADHPGKPDALVRIPANFDPSKPINLVIYNHGWGSTSRSAFNDNKLAETMANAPPNTVLIVPEWQRTAGASNSDMGRLSENGRFHALLQEVFDKTPELAGKRVQNVDGISIFSHSAGYVPSQKLLYGNSLGDKVKSITLLDSNYNISGFDNWIKANIHDLHSGKKQFHNIFFGTSSQSRQQLESVKTILRRAGLNDNAILEDNHGTRLLSAQEFAKFPIIFKFSSVRAGGLDPHFAIPRQYIAPVKEAESIRLKNDPTRRR